MINAVIRAVSMAGLLLSAGSALAAGGGETPVNWAPAYTNLDSEQSLQRGARLFVDNCLGCHSLKYMRYSRMAEDIGISEEQLQRTLMYTADKIHEPMTIAMRPEDQTQWFGAAAPDLSLTARSRGVDWIYSYLRSFYVDENRPLGWNNTVLPNASMPNVLWHLQGVQAPVIEERVDEFGITHNDVVGVELVEEGRLSADQFDQSLRDLVTFMEYVGEPAKKKRQDMGVWVLLFLVFLTFMFWLLKREYWSDLH